MAIVDASRDSLQGAPGNPTTVPYPRYSEFSPNRLADNPFYTSVKAGGFNTASYWDGSLQYAYYNKSNTVLANCTSYAQGRFNEIAGSWKWSWSGNANTYLNTLKAKGFDTGLNPAPGAIMCWSGHGAGHVEVVERVIDNNTVVTSSSGWGLSKQGFYCLQRPRGNGNWITSYVCDASGNSTGRTFNMIDSGYTFLGFIYHPSISYNVPTTYGGAVSEGEANNVASNTSAQSSSAGYSPTVEYKEVTGTVTRDTLRTANYSGQLNTHNTGLLTIPTYVEAPYISVRFGDYVLGTYTRNVTQNSERISQYVQYPNYINSLSVKKINGSVNQYTIGIIYQIEAGQDPNFIDKVLSSVQYGSIYISYGDCNAPNFYYKEEEALIINVSTNVEFSSSRISYTISATSASFQLYSGNNYFPPRKSAKPSDIIYELFRNENYGLRSIFKGMNDNNFNLFVARNDKKVFIEEKRNTDPLTYINYLVSCMVNENDTSIEDPLKSSNYYMTIEDDQLNEYGGSYFTIREVKSTTKSLYSPDTYEVDIGFPTATMVQDFRLNDNNSWSLLYKYSERLEPVNYTYNIDNQGNIRSEYSPSILTSGTKNKITPMQKTWWTQMTQFPISASLTIKGLVRPAMLMTYIRVNAYFYGQRHIASGLYVITGQDDRVDGGGYRTTLTLQRIGSDEDYITRTTETVTTKIPVIKPSLNNGGTNTTTGSPYKGKTPAQIWTEVGQDIKATNDRKEAAQTVTDTFQGILNDEELTVLEKMKATDNYEVVNAWASMGGIEADLDDVYENARVVEALNKAQQENDLKGSN